MQEATRSELANRYRIHAMQYLESANLICNANFHDHLIAPCCQNIGTSIELFLKFKLLHSGPPSEEPKCYGHDIMRMWQCKWAGDVRACAEEAAGPLIPKLMAKWGQPAKPTGLTPRKELTRNLEWLAEGYSSETQYALRYPRSEITTVPSPEFLIPIFEHVYDTIRYDPSG